MLSFNCTKKLLETNSCFKEFRDRGRVRTCNPQSRNLIFYPVELRSHYFINFSFKNSLPLPVLKYFSRSNASSLFQMFQSKLVSKVYILLWTLFYLNYVQLFAFLYRLFGLYRVCHQFHFLRCIQNIPFFFEI